MSLSISFAIALIICFSILFYNKNQREVNIQNYTIKTKNLVLALATIFQILLVVTIVDFVNPYNTKMYKNSDLYFVEHRGFTFKDSLYLVNEEEPQKAIWDDGYGEIKLKKREQNLKVSIKGFHKPFYIKDSDESMFHLKNSRATLEVVDSLSFMIKGEPLVLVVESRGVDSTIYNFSWKGETYKSKFKKTIFRGYPLLDIIEKTDEIRNINSIYELLKGSYLLRDKVRQPLSYINKAKEEENTKRLFLFIGHSLTQSPDSYIVKDNSRFSPNFDFIGNLNYESDFFAGFGKKIDVFKCKKLEDSKCVYLEYNFSKRYKLASINEKEDNEVCERILTSKTENLANYSPSSKNEVPEGYLFTSLFKEEDNLNHINSIFRYKVGPPNQPIKFKIFDHNFTDLEQRVLNFDDSQDYFLLNTKNKASSLKWVMSFNNNKNSNPLKGYWLILPSLILFCFLGLRVLIFSDNNYVSISRIELALFVILSIVLTFRGILIWRISTFFDPNIDLSSYNVIVYRGQEYFNFFWKYLISFICIWTLRIVWLSENSKPGHWLRSKVPFFLNRISSNRFNIKAKSFYLRRFKNEKSYNLVLIALGFLVLGALLYLKSVRLLNIYFPIIVSYYLLFNFTNSKNFSLGNYSVSIFTVLFSVLCFIAVRDSGYAIMYVVFLFSSIAIIFLESRNQDYQPHYEFKDFWTKENLITHLSLFLILFISYFIISFHSAILLWLFDYISILIIAVFCVIPIVFLFLFRKKSNKIAIVNGLVAYCFSVIFIILGLDHYLNKTLGSFADKLWILVMVLSLFLVVSWILKLTTKLNRIVLFTIIICVGSIYANVSPKLYNIESRYAYLKYRLSIIEENVETTIEGTNFKTIELSKILNAVHNQYLINYFIQEKYGEQRDLTLREHFTQGASHSTQISDLVIPRYVIAEHPPFIIYAILCLFAFLALLYYLSYYSSFKNKDKIIAWKYHLRLSTIVLLFISAFFVWLTATNRFTFFGQDFPFLSINSQLSLLLSFSLLAIAVWGINPEKEQDIILSTEKDIKTYFLKYWPVFFLLIVFIGFIIQDEKSQKFVRNKDFDLNELMARTDKNLNEVNEDFMKLQESEYLQEGNSLPILDSLLIDFFKKIRVSNSSKFFNSAIEYFKNEQINKRDADEFIHIVSRSGKYRFRMNRSYFVIRSPRGQGEVWKGSVLAAFVDRNNIVKETVNSRGEIVKSINDKFQYNNLFSKIDKAYSFDGNDIHLLKIEPTSDPEEKLCFDILNFNDALSSENDANKNFVKVDQTVRLNKGDVVRIYRPKTSKSIIRFNYSSNGNKYLARNSWINGKPDFYYPLREKSMWSYNLANMLKDYLSKNNVEYGDFVTTLDYSLNEDIYDEISELAFSGNKELERKITKFRNLSFNDKCDRNSSGLRLRNSNHNVISLESDNLSINTTFIRDVNEDIRGNLRNYDEISRNDEEDVNRVVNEAINEKIKRKFDFSVVGVDGNGKMRLMIDYGRTPKANPNNIKEYYSFLNNIYQSSSIALEREYLGNLALTRIPLGVGSSLKPITFSATITSIGENLDWDRLSLVTPEIGDVEKTHYWGRPIPGNWMPNIHGGMRAKNYLIRSDNLFHSLVISLGSVDYKSFSNNSWMINHLLQTNLSSSTIDENDKFPVIKYNGREYMLNPDNRPKFNETGSALDMSLNSDFGLHTKYDQYKHENYINYSSVNRSGKKSGLLNEIYNDSLMYNNYAYVFPERSWFLMSDRSFHNIRKQIIQPTLGGYPISLTPFKMAEMYGKLFTLNRDFDVSLEESDDLITRNEDHVWNNKSMFRSFQEFVFAPMNRVIGGGTFSSDAEFNKQKRRMESKEELYFFAKTGTIGNLANAKKGYENKSLAVVISNTNLSKCSFSEFKEAKVYILYFTFIDIQTRPTYYTHIVGSGKIWAMVDKVIKSDSFIEYFNQ